MPKIRRRTSTALTVAALLLCLIALPAAAASQPEPPAWGFGVADWLDRLTRSWAVITAGQETIPNIDPNGAEATPPDGQVSDPDATTDSPGDDGETIPNIDPDG